MKKELILEEGAAYLVLYPDGAIKAVLPDFDDAEEVPGNAIVVATLSKLLSNDHSHRIVDILHDFYAEMDAEISELWKKEI